MRCLTALRRVLAAVFILSCVVPLAAQAREPEIFTGLVRGVAVAGYDPVAYFAERKPVKGKAAISYQWKGASWRFSNEKNRDAFKAAPEKYAPQYGGYCAYAVSQGATAKAEPTAWTIVDGKLYLNYDKGVRKSWEDNKASYIKAADKNWPKVLGR